MCKDDMPDDRKLRKPLVELDRLAQARPDLAGVLPHGSLMTNSITYVIDILFKTPIFKDVNKVVLDISPQQYLWRVECDPIIPAIDRHLEWESHDTIPDILDACARLFSRQPTRRTAVYSRYNWRFDGFMFNHCLAEASVVAIGSKRGVWWQLLQRGWPLMPPTLCERLPGQPNLVVGASLSPRWWHDLPFTMSQVIDAIPAKYRKRVTIRWHADDDIFDNRFPKVDRGYDGLSVWLPNKARQRAWHAPDRIRKSVKQRRKPSTR